MATLNCNRQSTANSQLSNLFRILVLLFIAALFGGCAVVNQAADNVKKLTNKPTYSGQLYNPYCTDYELSVEGTEQIEVLYAGVMNTFVVTSPRFGDRDIAAIAKPVGSSGCNDDRVIPMTFHRDDFSESLADL